MQRVFLSTLFAFMVVCLAAQVPLFQRIGTRDGLAFREVHCMARDRDGVLWIGTAMGLSRYDGAGFRTFTTRDGLPSPRVRDIAVDRSGTLWLATPKGLASLDPRTGDTRTYLLDTTEARVLHDNHLQKVLPLEDGRILCAARERMWLLETATGRATPVVDPELGELAIHGNVLQLDSARGGVWISLDGPGLVLFDPATGRVHHAGNSDGHDPLLQGLKVSAMHRDRQGDLWMDDRITGGVMHFRAADQLLRRWPHIPGRPDLRLPQGALTIHRDRDGRVWMGGWDLRVVVFNPADSSVVRLPFEPEQPATLPNPVLAAMVEDEHGVLWLGTHMGLAVHDPRQLHYEAVEPSGMDLRLHQFGKNAAIEGVDGRRWIATESGLVEHDPSTGQAILHKLRPASTDWFANALLCIAEHDGVFWIGGRDGLWTFDPATRKAQEAPFRLVPEGAQHVSWLVKDAAGWFWAWVHQAGLFRFDPRTGERTLFKLGSGPDAALPPGVLYCGIKTADDDLWFGHSSDGLIRWDHDTDRFITHRDDVVQGRIGGGRVLALAQDARGQLWFVADGAGLIRYVPGTDTYTTYDERHGMPVPAAHAILPDRRGRIWVGTLKGLCVFDPERERFETLRIEVKRDTQFDDAGFCALALRDGSFLLTLDEHLLQFDPDRYEGLGRPAAPVLRGLTVNGVSMTLPAAGPLMLAHDQGRLAFRIATFDVPGRIVRYALRNASDSLWSEGTDPDIVLSDLRPGNYRFQYRTMAADGLWSPMGELAVTILPPWWQRTGARVFFAVLLALLIVAVFRLRLNWIRRRERRQEEQARLINDLKLQALRAQMDPHFIFNCLNSIDKYIVMEQGEQASRYLNKFARLIRLILNQSDSVSVPLEKEAELLRYYLELEALRFKHPFTWEVKVDPELLRAEAEVPTMLVQPYVENAIWHGLQHRPGAGRLVVEFRKMGTDMECVIEDDGIGRTASAAINADRRRVHQSKSMQVNADRMRLFAETHAAGVRVEVIDLKDREDKALGTRVRLVLPLESLEDEHRPV